MLQLLVYIIFYLFVMCPMPLCTLAKLDANLNGTDSDHYAMNAFFFNWTIFWIWRSSHHKSVMEILGSSTLILIVQCYTLGKTQKKN